MKRTILIAAGTATLAISALAHDANSDFRKFLLAQMPKVVKAMETKDVDYFNRMSTADFTDTEMGHTLNKRESMAEMKQSFVHTQSLKCRMRLVSSKVLGQTGTATTAAHFTFVTKPDTKGGRGHTMVFDTLETETWVRDGKGWKIKSLSQAKPMKATMDGKPFDPSKMGH